MQLINVTLEQLRSATKAQIINHIDNRLANMTKRQIIIWLMDNVDRVEDSPVVTRRADGQFEKIRRPVRDVETGNLVDIEDTNFTYYPSGVIDTISSIILDENEVEISRKVIQHYEDGRQPKLLNTMELILRSLGLKE